MSTAAVALPAAVRPAGSPSLVRLTRVELRKMIDTRAGLWLQLAVVALTILVAGALVLTGDPEDQDFRSMLGYAVQPAAILLPVVGILLVTSEWTQRTALITFTLVPRRSRVLVAKLAASVALSLGALLVAVVIAAAATVVAAPGVEGTWSLPAGLAGQLVVYLATAMITGVAFGALMLASAPAIVVYFALPLAWTAAGTLSFLEGAAGWLDGSRTLSFMAERLLTGDEWARAGATLALWMVAPLLVGAWRIVRGEVGAS